MVCLNVHAVHPLSCLQRHWRNNTQPGPDVWIFRDARGRIPAKQCTSIRADVQDSLAQKNRRWAGVKDVAMRRTNQSTKRYLISVHRAEKGQ